MDRKPWSKRWDVDYLADSDLNMLTFQQRGIVEVLWSISRTQMDEPGVFVKNGACLDSVAIARRVSGHHAGGTTAARYVHAWVVEALTVGPFRQREDGAWYSPRIIKETQEHEKLSTYGKKGREKQLGSLYYSANDTGSDRPGPPPGPPPGPEQSRAEHIQSRAEERAPRARARDDSANGRSGPPPEALLTLWNEVAKPPFEKSTLTSRRRALATELLRVKPDLGYWRSVIQRIHASAYCRGEIKNFHATFEFLLAEDTHVKVMEGNYDDAPPRASPADAKMQGSIEAATRFMNRKKPAEVEVT